MKLSGKINKLFSSSINFSIKSTLYFENLFFDLLLSPSPKKNKKALRDEAYLDGYQPIKHLTDIIVRERLSHFGPQLASFGYNMHLITLPEFHVTAYRMHDLAKNFEKTGIEAFVSSTQRPERILSEMDNTYTYYKHQTATGTGVEATFNKKVGSSDVNTLTDSTESDDIKKRN